MTLTLEVSCRSVDADEQTDDGEVMAETKKERDLRLSTSAFSRVSGLPESRVRSYKRVLIDLAHPSFRQYQKGELLNKDQQDLLLYYRSCTNQGKRGDALKRALFAFAKPYEHEQTLIADAGKELGLDEEQIKGMKAVLVSILREQNT